MSRIKIEKVQQIETVGLPQEFYQTQAKISASLEQAKLALSIADTILADPAAFFSMDNAIIQNLIAQGKAMLTSIQNQANNILLSINSMVTSITATYTGTAGGIAGQLAQINSIKSFIDLINDYISIINGLISDFNDIVSQIEDLVNRMENLQTEIGRAFQQGISDGINEVIAEAKAKEELSISAFNTVYAQMDGLQNTVDNIETITTDSWRQHIPPYTVDPYTPGPAPESNHTPDLIDKIKEKFQGDPGVPTN